jgi:Putative phage abortive infection protein
MIILGIGIAACLGGMSCLISLNDQKMKEKPSWFKKNLPWLVSLLLVAVCTWAAFYYYSLWLPTNTDQPNDEAGYFTSIFSPFIALAAAVITFAAFWIQYQANTEMRNSMDEQEKQQSIDRFEKIFFEMVHIHRENVRDFEITLTNGSTLKGNKAIKAFLIEIEVTYWLLHTWKKAAPDKGLSDHSPFDLINIAYLICYEGQYRAHQGRHHGQDLMDPSKPKLTVERADKLMGDLHAYLIHFYHGTLDELQPDTAQLITQVQPTRLPLYPNGEIIPNIPGYEPGQGYREHLSGYFRHLFHAFKYLDDDRILTPAQKDAYADMLRAHISDEAQTLLYYNSLTIWGKVWWGSKKTSNDEKGYTGMIMAYKLLRNVPLYQIPGEISPLIKAMQWLGKTPEDITQGELLTFFHYADNPLYLEWALKAR